MIGYIVNQINLGITGVIISYLLSATGRDKAILKGAGVTATAWLVLYGFTSKLGITLKSRKTLAPLLSFIDHMILGSLCGVLTSRFGDDALFPDIKQCNNNEKLPMFSTNTKPPCERQPDSCLG